MENSVDYLVFSLTSTSYAANAADMKTVVLSAFRIQYSVQNIQNAGSFS